MKYSFLLVSLFFVFMYAKDVSPEEELGIDMFDKNITYDANVSSHYDYDYAADVETNVEESNEFRANDETVLPEEGMVVVKDESGLSDEEVRKKAEESDKEEATKKSTQKQQQTRWEDLSPTPKDGYDWVQTTSGEWFKGHIKALFDDRLEFDSKEIKFHSFKFEKIAKIKSFNIISFAPDGLYERNFWAGQATVSFDVRKGNTNQYNYSAKLNLQRRTASTRLSFDYLGRVSVKNDSQTANDHRLNQKYDRYLTRKFFWTPAFSEIYTDSFKNIAYQVTLGAGIGYTPIDTQAMKLNFSGGPLHFIPSMTQFVQMEC